MIEILSKFIYSTLNIQYLSTVLQPAWGPPRGEGGQGGHGPPPPRTDWGACNAFGPPPPIFWENSVMKHN